MTAAHITKIAINAMGGHGGGVLANWIVETAEAAGYHAQQTSVPGFAQRSGATIYYVEICPKIDGLPPPVFALMAVPGDVDIVIASELAEGGRAVLRGLVTKDRTTLITSSHREYTTEEKLSRFDARRNPQAIFDSCARAAKKFIAFDMREAADQSGCLVSAVLFGALAGSNALPFGRDDFEATIRNNEIAVNANLKGFDLGFRLAAAGTQQMPAAPLPRAVRTTGKLAGDLAERIVREFPASMEELLRLGAARLVEYQNAAYARLYLDRVARIVKLDDAARGYELSKETARLLALRMAHEDVIRVADIKTRRRRFAEVTRDNRLEPDGVWDVVEYFAPRPVEVFDLLPAALGRRLAASPAANRILGRMLSGGFEIRTSRLPGFIMLYLIGRLKWMRPRSLAHAVETAFIESWLKLVEDCANDYDLALEAAKLLSLVRGYGSTLQRGRSNYETIVAAIPRLGGRADAATRLARLREAALADEDGKTLARALSEIIDVTEAA